MEQEPREKAIRGLRECFGDVSKQAEAIRAPLRICPVGAHVDHQYGRLMGMAIDRALHLAFIPRRESRVRLYSELYGERVEIDLTAREDSPRGHWSDFLRGAVWALRRRGTPVSHGWDGYLCSNTPVGGLGSSAAFGLSCLMALERANGLSIRREENVFLHCQLEREFVGVNVGLNDPMVITHSKKGCVVALDCLGERWDLLPGTGEGEAAWCLLYSGVERSLVGTEYNQRVGECREAAAQLARLGDLKVEGGMGLGKIPRLVYEQQGENLPPRLQQRARHFFTEVARVEEAVRYWSEGDVRGLGRLMNESCESSIQDYQSGAPQLIELARCARDAPGCYGCRFSGGGFGGFCLALVDPRQTEATLENIQREYRARQPKYAEHYLAYRCRGDAGIEILT